MIDAFTISCELTKASIASAHAEAIATDIQQVADHGDHVTTAELRAEIATVHGWISTEVPHLNRGSTRPWLNRRLSRPAECIAVAVVALSLAVRSQPV